MDSKDQYQYLFNYGEFLGDRLYYNCRHLLYVLDGRFFEVVYAPDANRIERIEMLTQVQAIKRYAGLVKLPKW